MKPSELRRLLDGLDEKKVNELLPIHEPDKVLSKRERKLVRGVKKDIHANKTENFVTISKL